MFILMVKRRQAPAEGRAVMCSQRTGIVRSDIGPQV